MPDTDPQLRQVILYRLDNLDRNVRQLVTQDQLSLLARRLDRLERDDEERERWMRQITISVILAAVSAATSLMIALWVH